MHFEGGVDPQLPPTLYGLLSSLPIWRAWWVTFTIQKTPISIDSEQRLEKDAQNIDRCSDRDAISQEVGVLRSK